MDTIHSPFSSLSIPSSLTKQLTIQQKPTPHKLFTTRKAHPLPPRSRLKTHALNGTFVIAGNTSGTIGGDISVLIPISALLLFLYWVSNFVVPGIVMKDLDRRASEGKEEQEEQTNGFEKSKVIENEAYGQPKTKLKKADLKKMINSKRF